MRSVLAALLIIISSFPSVFAHELVNGRYNRSGSGRPNNSRTTYALPAGFNPMCREFIRPDGSFGKAGNAMIEAISKVGERCFYEKADFSQICPAYKEFAKEEKQRFLLWLFASIAQIESSCEPTKDGQGTNDKAVGYFQLEDTKKQRLDAGRDPFFCKTDQPVNTKALKFQAECAASIFQEGYCTRRIVIGNGFWYWQKLNRPDRAIVKLAKAFPFCKKAPDPPAAKGPPPLPQPRPPQDWDRPRSIEEVIKNYEAEDPQNEAEDPENFFGDPDDPSDSFYADPKKIQSQ